ncbi:hypothetical protein FV218_08065 [Methylobacterium sp. WL69]|uniref:hypothetical protein n=1 Tax=Methylobacterium sp. WL69 TaxID=2603893 RepID=UPI0011C8801E|nr:hypothetical protein [Methylobacterium sp. WL69]TXM75773.1 hypothetical protein FV218_08065 [Methylobacterium sp. WL69]
MLDPDELLDVARLLVTQAPGTVPNQAQIRRSVSTAYYALFHAVLRRAADHLVGADQSHTAAYALVYRAFVHGRMKEVCQVIDKPSLSAPNQEKLKRTAFGSPLRFFATAFVELQDARHRADYDPHAVLGPSDAERACAVARFGLEMLVAADPDERRDVFALMLSAGRR